MTFNKRAIFVFLLGTVPALIIFALFVEQLNYTQDDAYISYRCVANYLNGDGLVYNVGERVEGITNFGWTIYAIFWGALGSDYIAASKLTGILLSAASIVLVFLIAASIFDETRRWYSIMPCLLVGANLSYAYWAGAGLETGAFAFFTIWSVFLYLRRSYWLVFTLFMAVWLRPEGALLAIILVLTEAILHRTMPWYSLVCGLAAFVLSVPYILFKMVYYGSLLPNPFYAKTGFDWTQIRNGLEYTWQFLSHYGFWGLGLIVPLMFYSKLTDAVRAIWLATMLYVGYVMVIGGDVLEVHRFFVPLFGLNAILLAVSAGLLFKRLHRSFERPLFVVVLVTIMALTWYLPREHVHAYREAGTGLNRKMEFMAHQLKATDDREFSVALTTIGIFGYELIGHDIIDMVGLTDTSIARHSDPPIEGLTTDWRESKHNTSYLMQRAPDYILFSTGMKPTSPGEKALCLSPRFLHSYRIVGYSYNPDPTTPGTSLAVIFRKFLPVAPEMDRPMYPVEYVEYYKRGMDFYSAARDHRTEIAYYDSAMMVSPKPYNPYLRYKKALAHLLLREYEPGLTMLEKLVEDDSLVFQAHRDLYIQARTEGNEAKAAIHARWIEKLAPWYLPRARELAEERIRYLQQIRQNGR